MPSGIYKRIKSVSLETRMKMRLKALGNKYSLGFHQLESTIQKRREKLLGKPRSIETRKKISAGHMGKVVTMETRNKMRLVNLGKKLSSETKEKLRISSTGRHHSILSRKKMSEMRMGKNSPGWRGGISIFNERIRKSLKYKIWRESIFNRDKYKCTLCPVVGGKLNADHIKPFSIIMKKNNIFTFENAMKCFELWDINNGRTLCLDCHKKTETHGNKKKIYE